MNKVSIFLILLTTTITTLDIDEFKDLTMTLSACMLFYFFGFYVTRELNLYIQRRTIQREIRTIFTDEFLERIKKDITKIKLENELKKVSSTELYPTQCDEK